VGRRRFWILAGASRSWGRLRGDTSRDATWGARQCPGGIASYLTLLWGNRLVNRESSREMRDILRGTGVSGMPPTWGMRRRGPRGPGARSEFSRGSISRGPHHRGQRRRQECKSDTRPIGLVAARNGDVGEVGKDLLREYQARCTDALPWHDQRPSALERFWSKQ